MGEKDSDVLHDKFKCRGVIIISRYGKRHELREMIDVVSALTPRSAHEIVELFCDSKATATYCAKVKAGTNKEDIAAELDFLFREISSGHNGIVVESERDPFNRVDIDPWWDGDY